MFKKSKAAFENKKQHILPVIGFEEPIIESAEGLYVYDLDGNKIMDLNGGQFCSIFGHSLPEFQTIFQNLATIQHTNTATLTKSTLDAYEKLATTMPEMSPQFITLSTGAEAIEFAMRFAKNYTGKTGLICFNKGYHGLSLGAQSITYGGIYAKPLHDDVYSLPIIEEHFTNAQIDEVILQLENICQNNANLAAMFFEPIIGVGGIHKLNNYFMKKVREICDKYAILLIFDECQSGFGRGGYWWYYQKLAIAPDLLVTAKGIGLGFPVSLVAVNTKTIDTSKNVTHYSSHQNDPFSAAIIDFGVDYIKEHNLLEEVTAKGEYFRNKLQALATNCQYISNPRGDGLIIGFDLTIDGVTNYRVLGAEFRRALCRNKVLIQGTNAGQTQRLLPSYLITYEEIDEFIKILEKTITDFDFEVYYE